MNPSREGQVVFDDSAYPVIVLRMPERGTIDSIRAWYDEVEKRLRNATEPLALVHDLRPLALSSITASHRHAVAEGTNRLLAPELASKLGADARIFGNAVIAGAVTAVSWMTGATPWPQGNFSDEADAIAWCRRELARRVPSVGA